jgi:hypothetical protein
MSNAFITRAKLAARVLLGKSPPRARGRDIPPISPEEIAEAKDFFPMDKFFIFGHARSGTTLLTRLVRLHPNVHCNYQAHFFTRAPLLQSLVSDEEVGAWLARRSNRWNRGSDLSPVILRAASDYILEREARREGARIVGDKSPNSLMDGEAVRLMHQVYPDARLIYIVRDGRDAALSHRFQAFIDKTEHLTNEDLRIREAFIQNPQPFLHGQRSIFTPKGIRQAAEGWNRNVVETTRMGKELYGDQFISLRYEDLLANPWEEMSRLWEFLGADSSFPELQGAIQDELGHNPDAEWQREKANEIAEALTKGKKGIWQELFNAEDRHIFHQIAGATLTAWGYSI